MKKFFKYLVVATFLLVVYIHFDTGSGIAKTEAVKIKDYQVDYDAISKEATSLLQELLAINTVRGNEIEAAKFFAKLLKKEGIKSTIISPQGHKDRASLYATIAGSEKGKGLIYTNHSDTVEAQAEEWSQKPFSGALVNGRIYGRGAIDMKGMAIMELMAFILAKRLKLNLKYNLMFLSIADEESGSNMGAKFLTREHKNIFDGYEGVVNEGGLGTHGIALKDKTILNIQYADKGILWLKVEARGTSGHGSLPTNAYAALKINKFLTKLKSLNKGIIISKITEPFFYQMGEASSFPNSYFLHRADNGLVKMLIKNVILGNKHLNAMTHNTIAITGLHTNEGKGVNVITAKANAKIDIRLLPGVRPNDFLIKVNNLANQAGVKINVVDSFASNHSQLDSRLFRTLAAVSLRIYKGATVTPLLSPSFTDNIFLRNIGLQCYGFIPVVLTSSELDGLHGKDEHLSVENLKNGIKILFETILAYNDIR